MVPASPKASHRKFGLAYGRSHPLEIGQFAGTNGDGELLVAVGSWTTPLLLTRAP